MRLPDAARNSRPRSPRAHGVSLTLFCAALGLLLAAAAFPAFASAALVDEQAQGKALAAEVNSGKKSCGDLSSDDFEHVGEYVMGHFVGSTSAHAAMNARMTAMMGSQGEARMHQLMGERYTGCAGATGSAGSDGMGPGMMDGDSDYGMGPGMMDDDSDYGNWGSMMDSGDWNWMMGGEWRDMSRQDWRQLQQRWMGTSAAAAHRSGGAGAWPVIAAALAVAVGVLLVLLLRRRRSASPPAAT